MEDIWRTLKLYSKHKVNQSNDYKSVLKISAFWESQLSIIIEIIYSNFRRHWQVNLNADLKFGSIKNKIKERHNIF